MKRILLFSILFFLIKPTNSQDVFDNGVRNIEIFFSDPNWDNSLDVFYANGIGERLVADSIIIDGLVDHDVGIKYKGNSSYNVNNTKNPLNIKLDYINNGQSIDGYNVLKLSNGFRDPSFVREVLSYQIAREYMPAPKATYANVFINGTLMGLYTCVQSIDDDFTNQHFYERKGPFFKAENTGISIGGCTGQLGILEHYVDTNCYQRAYEMQSSNDWEKLGNFLDTLNNHFISIENVMDIDRTLWMMAFENLTVCLDGPINSIPHNFYLFKDNNGRFSPVLWDMNMAFGSFTNGLPSPVSVNDLQELDIFHNYNDPTNQLTTKMFSNDRYRKMYVAHMRTILNEYFINNEYKNRASSLQAMISNYVSADPNTFYSYPQFTNNLNSSVGVNPVVGISELMDTRVTFLQSLNEFTSQPPLISNISSIPSNVLPHTTINITAQITDGNYVYLGYRFKFSDKFQKLQMYDDGNHGDGLAGDGVYGITLDVDARDIQYYIYAENSNAGIFSPERAEHEFHQIPVVSSLVINEIMASNFSKVADQDGEYDDWVELYNASSNPINLSGFYLSDDENTLDKWTFPNVTIQANDYLIIWCDTAGSSQSGLHTTYRLSADQEEVYLIDPSGIVIDAVHFVNMPTDLAYARVPNGNGVFLHQDHSQGLNNQSISNTNSLNFIGHLRVYPNPSSNKVYILGSLYDIQIYNISGKLILHTTDKTIDVSNWDKGLYFIKSGVSVSKLIIN